MGPRPLILASSSPFRRALLERLQLPFTAVSPDIDETPLPSEAAVDLVLRLAIAKARAVTANFTDALVIGSDQVAVHDGHIVGKPRDHVEAVAQLRHASGRKVILHTGLALIDAGSGRVQSEVVDFRVEFRQLDETTIERYLAREDVLGCSGSLRADGLGIALLQRLDGDDPNALIGLPLIRLVRMLENEGVRVV